MGGVVNVQVLLLTLCSCAAVHGAAAPVSKDARQWNSSGLLQSIPAAAEALVGKSSGTVRPRVEVHEAATHGSVPAFLNSAETHGTVFSMPGTPRVEALVDHNASSTAAPKRHRRYVTPVGYNETDSGDLAASMNLPDERDGLKLSRWVICSWVVANITAVDAVRNRNSVFLERIPELLRSVQDLAPSQVYAVAAANVTLGFQFDGIDGDTLSPAAAAALKHTASEMAGGYSEQLITVSTAPPAQSLNGNQVELQTTVEDAPAATSVVKRGKDLGQPTEAPPAVTAGRRLHGAGSAPPAALAGFLAQGNTQQPAVSMAMISTPGLPRRLMQDAAYLLLQDIPQPAKSPPVRKGNSVPVWLMYKHVAPANTTTLLLEFCTSCNVTPTVAAGFDLAPQPCGVEVKAALEGAGVQLVDDSYAQLLTIPPTISLSVRLAVGMTAAQVAAGTDVALAEWLAQPSTAQAVARMYAPDAVIRWLHTPEIWYQKNLSASNGLSPGAAAGIAVGCTAAVCGAVVVAAWLIHRRKQQAAAAAVDKTDASDSQSSGRRRRRQGKRRYLLPDPPRPDSQATRDAGAAGASTSGVAHLAHDDVDGACEDDADLSPDQIRPQLRSLGDSVTSAVRFEEDSEEGEAGQEMAEQADLAAAGPSTAAVAGASAAAAVAAGAVAAGAAAGASSSTPSAASSSSAPRSKRSVLFAREAILAEYRQNQKQQSGGAVGPSSSSIGVGSSVPAAVSPELAAAAEISSAVGTPNHDSSLSPVGMSASADGMKMTPRLLKPVDERAAAASAAAVAAAAALPQSGAVAPSAHRKSPFVLSYNFDGLADTSAPTATSAAAANAPAGVSTACPAAAMAAASAKAVVLPPRRLPLSPVSTSSSDLGSQLSVTQTATGDARSGSTPRQGPAADAAGQGLSSGGSSGSEQQQQRGKSPTALGAVLTRRSSSSGGSSSPAADGTSTSSRGSTGRISPASAAGGSQGVGLAQLVSISSPTGQRVSDGSADGCSNIVHAHAVLPSAATSYGSTCSSGLQGPSESFASTLQLSSSLSGPVLHSNSTSQGLLSPTYSVASGPIGPSKMPEQRNGLVTDSAAGASQV